MPQCRRTWAQRRDQLGRSPSTATGPSSRVGKEVPDLKRFKAGGRGARKGNTHMRTGLMAFLMLPKAARPSSSRRHLSASSAGFSFSFSGAWRGEGDSCGNTQPVGEEGWNAQSESQLCAGFLCFPHVNRPRRTSRNLM